MTINITNREASELTRKFARIEGVSLTEAVVIAMREALERRLSQESPVETAARLREEFGISLSHSARKPLDRSVFDDLSGDASE
jgi:antitoxin VapB